MPLAFASLLWGVHMPERIERSTPRTAELPRSGMLGAKFGPAVYRRKKGGCAVCGAHLHTRDGSSLSRGHQSFGLLRLTL